MVEPEGKIKGFGIVSIFSSNGSDG